MMIWVNLAGAALIALIVWWFWLSHPRARRIQGAEVMDVLVDNGVYTPARIEVAKGQTVTLRFLRKDASPCAEKVLFDDFNIGRDLPLNRPVEVRVTPDRTGEFEFTCQMKMYRGTLVVR
jgi:plastocyanin domain-containing protein